MRILRLKKQYFNKKDGVCFLSKAILLLMDEQQRSQKQIRSRLLNYMKQTSFNDLLPEGKA